MKTFSLVLLALVATAWASGLDESKVLGTSKIVKKTGPVTGAKSVGPEDTVGAMQEQEKEHNDKPEKEDDVGAKPEEAEKEDDVGAKPEESGKDHTVGAKPEESEKDQNVGDEEEAESEKPEDSSVKPAVNKLVEEDMKCANTATVIKKYNRLVARVVVLEEKNGVTKHNMKPLKPSDLKCENSKIFATKFNKLFDGVKALEKGKPAEQTPSTKELVVRVPKDEGPKDEGSKDEGPKDEGPKDEGPKDEGHKDEGPKDEGPKEKHGIGMSTNHAVGSALEH